MNKINASDSAFPVVADFGIDDRQCSEGLTKREYFAAMAMQGLCANSVVGQHSDFSFLATEAVKYSDALIKELNKQTV
jgi:hypothetical protein